MGIKLDIVDNSRVVLGECDAKVYLALEAVGKAAVTNVQTLTPVGTPESTGRKGYIGGTLRGSIDSRVTGDTVAVGTNVKYGKYVEYRDELRHLTGQAHFLRDGIQNNLSAYRELLKMYLNN